MQCDHNHTAETSNRVRHESTIESSQPFLLRYFQETVECARVLKCRARPPRLHHETSADCVVRIVQDAHSNRYCLSKQKQVDRVRLPRICKQVNLPCLKHAKKRRPHSKNPQSRNPKPPIDPPKSLLTPNFAQTCQIFLVPAAGSHPCLPEIQRINASKRAHRCAPSCKAVFDKTCDFA